MSLPLHLLYKIPVEKRKECNDVYKKFIKKYKNITDNLYPMLSNILSDDDLSQIITPNKVIYKNNGENIPYAKNQFSRVFIDMALNKGNVYFLKQLKFKNGNVNISRGMDILTALYIPEKDMDIWMTFEGINNVIGKKVELPLEEILRQHNTIPTENIKNLLKLEKYIKIDEQHNFGDKTINILGKTYYRYELVYPSFVIIPLVFYCVYLKSLIDCVIYGEYIIVNNSTRNELCDFDIVFYSDDNVIYINNGHVELYPEKNTNCLDFDNKILQKLNKKIKLKI